MTVQSHEKMGELWLHPSVRPLSFSRIGPFVATADGRILTVDDQNVLTTEDEGLTWCSHPLFDYQSTDKEYKISPERVLHRTSTGVIILSFLNLNEKVWLWNDVVHDALPGTRLPHYVMRSIDEGTTWQDAMMLNESWTGDVRDVIETSSGGLVLSSMNMLSSPGRHGVLTYVSEDSGETWKGSNVIDLGGIGHHGGVSEATIEELSDGRIWMLMRTNWGRFWEAFSEDGGLSWRDIRSSRIDASSAPGILKRLSGGRLVLVWNRQYPEGQHHYPLTGGDGLWSEAPVSNHREELSIAFSEDEGNTWTSPIVLARRKGAWLSYPRVFELSAGVLWLTTMQGGICVQVEENDLVAACDVK